MNKVHWYQFMFMDAYVYVYNYAGWTKIFIASPTDSYIYAIKYSIKLCR